MHKSRWPLAMFAGIVLVVALAGCAQQPTAVEPAKQQAHQTSQAQASVDATLNAIGDQLTELAGTAGGLDARANGLEVDPELKDFQRRLTDAVGQAGDRQKVALEQLSTSFNELIANVDEAAARLPYGGQTELVAFSKRLKDIQTSLDAASASVQTSSTP